SPLRRAGGHKNDDCPVMPLPRRKMNGMLAARLRLARKNMLLHVLLRENRTCGSTSLRYENIVGHSTWSRFASLFRLPARGQQRHANQRLLARRRPAHTRQRK